MQQQILKQIPTICQAFCSLLKVDRVPPSRREQSMEGTEKRPIIGLHI